MTPTSGLDGQPVEYVPAPGAHLWVATCLGLGGALLAVCLMLGLGELLFSAQRSVLEALFLTHS
jgi:hypothetical protein